MSVRALNNGGRILRLQLSHLIIPDCQRDEERAHIRKMAAQFDERAVGVPVVGRRIWSGEYVILDGQQRCAAAKLKFCTSDSGCTDLSLECLVLDVPNQEEESRLFDTYNTHKKVGLNDRIHAKMDYGDPHAVELQQVVESCSYRLPLRSADRRKGVQIDRTRIVKGLNFTSRMLSQYGAPATREVLTFINMAFGDEADATGQRYQEGVCYFLANLDRDYSPELGTLAYALKTRFNEIRLEAERLHNRDGIERPKAFAMCVVDAYNKYRPAKGRGTKARLLAQVD